MQKILIIIGLVIVAVGIFYPYLRQLPFGQLPGDILYQSGKFSFAFPIVTCIIISVVLTMLINIFK